jgi:hypothetical protein
MADIYINEKLETNEMIKVIQKLDYPWFKKIQPFKESPIGIAYNKDGTSAFQV